jgi:hypothetical protein
VAIGEDTGIRIENNVLVAHGEPEILAGDIPILR